MITSKETKMVNKLNRRDFIKLISISTAAIAVPECAKTFAQDTNKTSQTNMPNVILCMTDDQGWGDTGYNGHPRLKTPNLDEMSKSGIRFDRWYAGAPVCSS